MVRIEVKTLLKSFEGRVILNGISFSVDSGQLLTLLGPSGCGKTTTLRCIAGLEKPDAGEITIAGNTVSSSNFFLPPEKRNIGMVYQSYALWPHMSVYDNVSYGLRLRRLSRKEMDARVTEVLQLVGLESLRNRSVTELSGGEQQRVAVARSMVVRP